MLTFDKKALDWNALQEHVDYLINASYKDFYERVPGVAIDDYIYIKGIYKYGESMNLNQLIQSTLDAYVQLSKYLSPSEKIDFGPHCENWLPVGLTTNGDFIICSDTQVMILDEGFEDREVYSCSLFEFVMKYINDDLMWGPVIDDEAAGKQKHLLILN